MPRSNAGLPWQEWTYFGSDTYRNRRANGRNNYAYSSSHKSASLCHPYQHHPFPKSMMVTLSSNLARQVIVNATTPDEACIARLTLYDINHAKRALDAADALEGGTVVRTAATTPTWSQFETPRFSDVLDTIYEHMEARIQNYSLTFTNLGGTASALIFWKVIADHSDEDKILLLLPYSQASIDRLEQTPGVKCLTLAPSGGSLSITKRRIDEFEKTISVTLRDSMVSKKTKDHLHDEHTDTLFRMGNTAAAPQVTTSVPDQPRLLIWAFRVDGSDGLLTTVFTDTDAVRLMVRGRSTLKARVYGRRIIALENDDPDA